MLTIRKQNFDSQQCYCCAGMKANICDPNSSVVYRMYHRLPDKTKHIQVQVVVPRCKYCADKMKPILPIALVAGLAFGGISGFLYTISAHGVLISLLCGFLWAAVVALAVLIVLDKSFSIVYGQKESNYEIITLLRNRYGWQTNEPKEGDADTSFIEKRMDEMLNDLVTNYNCEYGDI